MREFEVTFKDELHKGLRPEEGLRNSSDLMELKNVRVGLVGLEDYEDISQPFTLTSNWPFTQVKRFERDFLAFDETAVYKLNADWSKTTLFSGLAGDLTWHGADFIDYVVLTNGSVIYDRDSSTGNYVVNNALPSFKTCDNVNGRLVVGNISNFHDCDSTFVAWSRIGDTTFEPDQRQESGYSPAWSGEIYQVKKLGNGFVAYGANGIRGFKLSGTFFEQKQLAKFGIASRDAVGGDENSHLLMDDTGALWMIDGSFKMKRVGYKEFFSSWVGDDIIISYNSNPGEFYLSNGSEGYLLYQGLSQIRQIVSGVEFYNGSKVGMNVSGGESEFYLKTGAIDFNIRGFKRIESIELGVDSNSQLEVALEYRPDKFGNWSTSEFKRVNKLGNTYLGVESNEFRVIIRTQVKASVNLDYMTIRFKLPDKRGIRGQYSAG